MADGNYEVKIATQGDPSGAQAVTKAVKETGSEAIKAAAATEKAAEAQSKSAGSTKEAESALKGQQNAIKATVRELETLIELTRQAGGDTSGLDQELAQVRATAARGVLAKYTAELEDAIVTTKAAGADASAFERRLAALSAPSAVASAKVATVSKAAEDVGKATKETAAQTRTFADDLTSLGSRTNPTKDVLEGLDAVLRGNANSIFGVAKSLTNLGEILTVSTPAGRALQLALIGINSAAVLLPLVMEKFSSTAEDAGASAGDAAPKINTLAEALNKAGAAQGEAFKKRLDDIKTSADAAAKELERVITAERELSQSKKEAALAKIDADPNLTASERFVKRQAIEDEAVRRERELAERQQGAEWNAARTGVERAQAEVSKAQGEVMRWKEPIEADAAIQRNRRQRVRELEEERAAIPDDMPGSDVASGEDEEKAAARARRRMEIDAELSRLKRDRDFANAPAQVEAREAAQRRLDDARAQAKAAAEELVKREAVFKEQQQRTVAVNPDGSLVLPPTAAATRLADDEKRAAEAQATARKAVEEDEKAGRKVDPVARAIAEGRKLASAQYGSKTEVSGGDPRDVVGNVGGRAVRRDGTVDAMPSDEGMPVKPKFVAPQKDYEQMARDAFAEAEYWTREAMRKMGISDTQVYRDRFNSWDRSEAQEGTPPAPPLIEFSPPPAETFLAPKPAEDVKRASQDFYKATSEKTDYSELMAAITGMTSAVIQRTEAQQRQIDEITRTVRDQALQIKAQRR